MQLFRVNERATSVIKQCTFQYTQFKYISVNFAVAINFMLDDTWEKHFVRVSWLNSSAQYPTARL